MAQRASDQRSEAIRALYQSHGARLFRIALRVGGGRRSFAEDVVQDTFEKLLLHYDRLDSGADLGGWLYRVAMNASLSRLRRESFRNSAVVRALLGQGTDRAPSADVAARLTSLQREALEALSLLPPRERIAFCMVHLDDAQLKEVADALGCSLSYACKLAQRAEDVLAKHGWRGKERAEHRPHVTTDPNLREVSLG
jgi:RNA polymerase sigma-70 factor (ECF subfamily)